MKVKLILLFIVAVIAAAFTRSDETGKIVTVNEFKKQLDAVGLIFEMPAGYKETYVHENNDLVYNFAIKNKKEDFEIRYTIFPLKPSIAEYNICKQDTNCTMVDPNTIYKEQIAATVLNMTGGEKSNLGPFSPGGAKKDFNADRGGSAFFKFKSDFGKGYKYGQVIYLHKDNVGDVVITYMSNNGETHVDLMKKAFYALKFK
jgi:hypothetical protein